MIWSALPPKVGEIAEKQTVRSNDPKINKFY